MGKQRSAPFKHPETFRLILKVSLYFVHTFLDSRLRIREKTSVWTKSSYRLKPLKMTTANILKSE